MLVVYRASYKALSTFLYQKIVHFFDFTGLFDHAKLVLICKFLGVNMTKKSKSTEKSSDIKDHFSGQGNLFSSDADGFSKPNSEPKEPVQESKPEEDSQESSDEEPAIEELTYSERLEKVGISDDKATKIIDDICEEGSYMESFIVRKARGEKKEIKVVFNTRDTRSQGYITTEVSQKHGGLPIIFNKLMGEMQLAASILHYNGTTYPPLVEIEDEEKFKEAIYERMDELSKLPAPVTVVILRHLSQFDLEVASVMAPGYEDFF